MIIRNDAVNAFLDYGEVEVPSAAEGPLKDLTFAVKDIFDVAGYPTGGGSPIMAAESPIRRKNAPIVQKMLDAGALFVGKTQTDELTFSMNGQNKHYPEPINPRAEGRITGGSSSGSAAAVAARLCDFSIGSDTGGSVRTPASYCGLWGIRPTHGRVDNSRAMPLAPSFDTVGYFADDPEIFGRVAPVFLGEDEGTFALTRLMRAEDAFVQLVSDSEASALEEAEGKAVDLLGDATTATVAPEGLDHWYWTFRRLQAVEAWKAHGEVDRRARSGHDAGGARALRVRQDARRGGAAGGAEESSGAARARQEAPRRRRRSDAADRAGDRAEARSRRRGAAGLPRAGAIDSLHRRPLRPAADIDAARRSRRLSTRPVADRPERLRSGAGDAGSLHREILIGPAPKPAT